MLITTSHFFKGYLESAKYPLNKNYVSCSSRKIIVRLAYLSVKIMSLNEKHKIVMKVASLSVSVLRISFKEIKSSGKLPVLV